MEYAAVLTLLQQQHTAVINGLQNVQLHVAAVCSEVIPVSEKRLIFGNLKEVLATHAELAELVATNTNISFANLGYQLVDFFFFSNFIVANSVYCKARTPSSLTLKQVYQTNKKFASLVEDGKSGSNTQKSLEKVLNGPLDFIRELCRAIATLSDSNSMSSKEQRVWNGIARNLQPVCNDEERTTQKRVQENRLFQLELRILEYPEKSQQAHRYLILQSSIEASVMSAGSNPKSKFLDFEAVLTNDALLLLKKSKRHKGMFDFKCRYMMDMMNGVENVGGGGGSGGFDIRVLFAPDTTLVLRFDSQGEVEKWMSELKQNIPNSGEMTERNGASAFGSPSWTSSSASNLHSATSSSSSNNNSTNGSSNSPSRASNRSVVDSIDGYSSQDPQRKSSASDLDDAVVGDGKKRKKRSTSSSSHESKQQLSNTSPPPASVKSSGSLAVTNARGGSGGGSGGMGGSAGSGSGSGRSSTEAKRSKFLKSLSVSTISSPAVVSKALPRVRVAKRVTEWNSTTSDVESKSIRTSQPPTSSSRPPSSSSSLKLGTTSDEIRKKKRSESATSLVESASASSVQSASPSISPSPSMISNSTTSPPHSRASPPPTGVSRLDLVTISPPHQRPSGSDSIIITEHQLPPPPHQQKQQHQKKYLLHPPRAVAALDNSSDYEESEDEPARIPSMLPDGNNVGFFKPHSRESSSQARNLQSSSVRELRSGSIDDMSAREPPVAPGTKSFHITTLPTSSQHPQSSPPSSISTIDPHSQEIQSLVQSVLRMESDLTSLKASLSRLGFEF